MKFKEFISVNFNIYYQRTFSYYGEDTVLKRIMNIKNGFYVDVGANHPSRFSNTWHLYKQGWNGLNVDLDMKLFRRFRKRDINVEAIVSNIKGARVFHIDTRHTGNLSSLEKIHDYTKMSFKTVQTRTLKNILDEHNINKIDLLDIDCEGHDYEVLLSHNWDIRPKYILIEIWNTEVEEVFKSSIYTFLKKIKYRLRSINVNTLIWEREDLESKIL